MTRVSNDRRPPLRPRRTSHRCDRAASVVLAATPHRSCATSEPLADSERVAALFSNTRKDAYGAYESYLGAEHADPSPRKTAAAKRQANAGGFDQRAVKIYG